jgi:hypothetical protein
MPIIAGSGLPKIAASPSAPRDDPFCRHCEAGKRGNLLMPIIAGSGLLKIAASPSAPRDDPFCRHCWLQAAQDRRVAFGSSR